MSDSEAIIEAYLVSECKKIKGIAEKFVSPNKRAVPDRLCQFPYDLIIFVELKAEGKKPTPAQAEDHRRRKLRGHTVEVLDSKAAVDNFINGVKETLHSLAILGNLT